MLDWNKRSDRDIQFFAVCIHVVLQSDTDNLYLKSERYSSMCNVISVIFGQFQVLVDPYSTFFSLFKNVYISICMLFLFCVILVRMTS